MNRESNLEEIVVYDFSNLDLQENSANNCFGFLDDDDCDNCDMCDSCDHGW